MNTFSDTSAPLTDEEHHLDFDCGLVRPFSGLDLATASNYLSFPHAREVYVRHVWKLLAAMRAWL